MNQRSTSDKFRKYNKNQTNLENINKLYIIYLEVVLECHILYDMQNLLHEQRQRISKGHHPSKYASQYQR